MQAKETAETDDDVIFHLWEEYRNSHKNADKASFYAGSASYAVLIKEKADKLFKLIAAKRWGDAYKEEQ